MTTYKVTNSAGGQMWTRTGNKAGVIPTSAQFESNNTLTIKDRLCRLIESGGYAGKYVEAKDVTAIATEPPVEPPPTGDTITFPAGQLQLQTPEGIYQNLGPVTLTKATG